MQNEAEGEEDDDDEEDENDEQEDDEDDDDDDEMDEDELKRVINSHLKSVESSAKGDKQKPNEKIVSTSNTQELGSKAKESKPVRNQSDNSFSSQNSKVQQKDVNSKVRSLN